MRVFEKENDAEKRGYRESRNKIDKKKWVA